MPVLQIRDDGWSDSGGARWAFFAIFIVLILIVVAGTLRVNKKRSRHGAQPIYGTRWITPPSYRQSQTSHRQRDGPETNYVPTYSEQAGDTDMGFYDNSGVFHPNPNAKSPFPEVHVRLTTATEGVPLTTIPSLEDDDLFRRPVSRPPTTQNLNTQASSDNIGINENVTEDQSTRYTSLVDNVLPPDGPPPGSSPPPFQSSGNINNNIRRDSH